MAHVSRWLLADGCCLALPTCMIALQPLHKAVSTHSHDARPYAPTSVSLSIIYKFV